MTCRFVLAAVLAVFGAAAGAARQAAPTNLAQAYPARPIRILVLNTPGSGTDIVSRLVANKLTQAWGQQVVVDNRAGASGNIGAEIGARAAPDGYTLVMITSQQPIVVAMFGKLNYEWIGWYGLVAPAGTPGEIIAKLNAEQIKALKTAEFKERLAGLGAEPLGTTPQEYASHLRTQLEKMRLAIKLSGARPD
jgi:tripartite-type tricarboxylate transporter receptor subunit TctC